MKSRFAAFLCVMAVFQLLGGHLAVLQITAWVRMLVKYSEDPVNGQKTVIPGTT